MGGGEGAVAFPELTRFCNPLSVVAVDALVDSLNPQPSTLNPAPSTGVQHGDRGGCQTLPHMTARGTCSSRIFWIDAISPQPEAGACLLSGNLKCARSWSGTSYRGTSLIRKRPAP